MNTRRAAWLFFLSGAILLFLAVLKLAFTLSGLPDWLEPAGLCSCAIAATAWTFPVVTPRA